MERFFQIIKRVFVLPTAAIVLIDLPSFAAVIYALASGKSDSAFAYLSYVASAYALAVTVIAVLRLVRKLRSYPNAAAWITRFSNSRFGAHDLSDPLFRAKISLYFGLTVGIFFALIHFFAGLTERSAWFFTLAGYHFLIALLRYLMLSRIRFDSLEKQYRLLRLCGILLLLMNQVLAVVCVQIVRENQGHRYPGILIYVMAAYAFYAVILAVRSLFKYRNYGKPILLGMKALSLTSALVSLLSLETAMLDTFGDPANTDFRALMTSLTSAGVCIIVLIIAIFMIIRAHRAIRTTKEKE